MPLVAHTFGKVGNDLGVAQIGFLRNAAHGQVLAHHKLDKLCVFAGKTVLSAKASHLGTAQFGVVAPTALGNVVEDGGNGQQPGLVPPGSQL